MQRAPLDASQPSSMLKLRGLPFSATAHDIANWFNTGVNVFNLTAESCVAAPPSFPEYCTKSAALGLFYRAGQLRKFYKMQMS